jgi:hypothetical protein
VLDEHTYRGLFARALDGVARPVAWHDAIVDLGRSHVDADHVGDLPVPIRRRLGGRASRGMLRPADLCSR